jgi:hypothetical protein
MKSLFGKTINLKTLLLLLALVLLIPLSSHAAFYSFYNITNNNATDAAIGETQLRVNVTDAGSGNVLFAFENTGPYPSSITDIYFEQGVLGSFISLDDSDPGVSFGEGASPPNLPGGNDPSVNFATYKSFDSNPAAQPNGVNPGESLGITFSLASGSSFSDVLAGLDSGSMRVGIHVQGFTGGGSESFVTPIPSTVLLMIPGLLGLARFIRRKYRA